MRVAGLLLAALMMLPVALAAGTGTPTNLTGVYDGPTDTLRLSWDAPVGGADSYRIYEGTSLLGTTSSGSYDIVMGSNGPRSFSVSAVLNSIEGERTATLTAFRLEVPTDPNCRAVGITTYPGPPYVTYALHEECLPP